MSHISGTDTTNGNFASKFEEFSLDVNIGGMGG
jgi:hypothetical protein